MPVNTTTAADTPAYLPVAIAGHQYLIDLNSYNRETVDTIRQQSDTSTEPGEQSLSPLGLWWRSQESWHHGAGQPFLDGKQGLSAYSQVTQDPHRYRTSKGLNPWTQGQISLLNDTVNIWPSSNTNLAVVTGGVFQTTYVAIADGNEMYATAGPPINLLSYANSNFESGTGTWVAGTLTTMAGSATGAFLGSNSLKITSNGTTTPSVHTPTGVSGIPVTPGRSYSWAGTMIKDATATARTWTINVTWWSAAGAQLTTVSITSVSTDSGFASMGNAATAPPTAAFASFEAMVNGTASSGEIHYLDAVSFGALQPGTGSGWRSIGINGADGATTVNSITTDGIYAWAAMGLSGIHRVILNAQFTVAANVPGPLAGTHFVHLVGYANGRLLAAGSPSAGPNTQRNVLFEIGAPLGTPDWYGGTGTTTPLMTHPNPNFIWTFISPGRNCIYAGGNTGGNGEVYRITMEATSTALGAATHATYLPDGESIHALQFYAGAIIMGTNKGVRLGTADGAGNIDYGPLIPTTFPVRCLEPQDRYCWFGLTKYDSLNGGLGRIDLGFLTDQLTPAWASDVMALVQNDVTSAATWASRYAASAVTDMRLFAVSGIGIFAEDTGAKVASGTLETGAIRFSTSVPKQNRIVEVRHHALAGTIGAELKVDGGSYVSVGTSSTAASSGAQLSAAAAEGESAELRFTLNRAATLAGPEQTRWTLKSLPLPHIDEVFTLPLELKPKIRTDQGPGSAAAVDVAAEVTFLKGLERTRTVVSFQVGSETLTGYILKSSQHGAKWGRDGAFLAGTYVVQLQTVET